MVLACASACLREHVETEGRPHDLATAGANLSQGCESEHNRAKDERADHCGERTKVELRQVGSGVRECVQIEELLEQRRARAWPGIPNQTRNSARHDGDGSLLVKASARPAPQMRILTTGWRPRMPAQAFLRTCMHGLYG